MVEVNDPGANDVGCGILESNVASHKTKDTFPVKTPAIVEKDAQIPGTQVVQNPP